MEGHFQTEEGAGLVIVGQPNMETMTIDNPIVAPRMLSIMTHQRWASRIEGLEEFPQDQWPDNVPLLYYAYHVMVGLGTIFIALMGLAFFLLRRGRLHESRRVLWALMLAMPLPYIANTAGWMTSELGRQPWLIHEVMRTADGSSAAVSGGNALFTLLGFMGLYALLAMLYFSIVTKLIRKGAAT
jgi:cytochrome d ubiquinol oxidase subunit I